jgi:hypothetical protein
VVLVKSLTRQVACKNRGVGEIAHWASGLQEVWWW